MEGNETWMIFVAQCRLNKCVDISDQSHDVPEELTGGIVFGEGKFKNTVKSREHKQTRESHRNI